MFEKVLVYAVIGNKEIHCGLAELRVKVESACGHGSLLLDLYYFPASATRTLPQRPLSASA
jgi:hypothetical protein